MTSDPYATRESASDPYGAKAMQRAVDTVTDAMATKLKGAVLGVPGPDPLRVEVWVEPPGGGSSRVEVSVPLGAQREALGYVISAVTAIVNAAQIHAEDVVVEEEDEETVETVDEQDAPV